MGGGPQQLDLVIHKTVGGGPQQLDEIVSVAAYDDDNDGYDIYGCDMGALGSCG